MVQSFNSFDLGPNSTKIQIVGYWCASTVKLPYKVTTPLGNRVTVLDVCVDLRLEICDQRVFVESVRLSSIGTTIVGSPRRINLASPYVGLAWYGKGIPSVYLLNAVQRDMEMEGSPLLKLISRRLKKQRSTLAETIDCDTRDNYPLLAEPDA